MQIIPKSGFNCLNYILLYAERQMPLIFIERQLFALAISTWEGTLHQIQSEAPRKKYISVFTPQISIYFDYESSPLQ